MHEVEFWEKKGDEIMYAGEDKARKINKSGVSFIGFLKNRSFPYQNVKFPDAECIYKKKLFGTKLKLLIINDELIPFKMRLGNPHNVVIDSMPAYQKIDYMQKLDLWNERYNNKGNSAAIIQLLGFGLLITAIIVWGFFQWQQNVEVAKAMGDGMNAMASAANNLAVASGTTVPPASPG
jgi:hypothetical protein